MSAPILNQALNTQDLSFQYIALSPKDAEQDACKFPQTVKWDKFLADNKRVVITGAPAAFSPTCSVSHIPGYVAYLEELVEDKKVDQVVVLTVDNPFANQAWAKSLGVKDSTHIKFGCDPAGKLIKSLGYELQVDEGVFWSGRWTIIVEDGKVTYAAKEENPGTEVTVSSVEQVIAHL
ncbi:peroxiredoxin Ahp1p [Monosporozyma servazzii]